MDEVSRIEQATCRQRWVLGAVAAIALIVAEGKLVWYSFAYRSLDHSVQGVLLREAERIRGRRVFHTSWNRADEFVVRNIVEAERAELATVEAFIRQGGPDDYLVAAKTAEHLDLVQLASRGQFALFQKR